MSIKKIVTRVINSGVVHFTAVIIPAIALSIGIILLYWTSVDAPGNTPVKRMMLYIGTTVFFSILGTAVMVKYRRTYMAAALYVTAFLWLAGYIGQRIVDFDFFSDYYFRAAYLEEKNKYKPEVALSILQKGDAALSTGDFRKAKLHYYTALQFDTSNARIYFSLGNAFMRAGSPDTALTFFREGLARDFEQPMIHNYVGVLSEKIEDYKTAVLAFKTAILQDSTFDIARRNLAAVLRKKNNYDQAVLAGMMRVRQIVVDTKDEAKTILKRIKKGDDFAVLAQRYSIDPTGKNGGLTAFFSPNQPDFNLAQITRELEPGEVSDIIEYGGKYIIVKRIN